MADAELEDTARIARDLIRFETVNWGGGKSNGETDAAEYIAAELTRLGLSPQLFESEPGRTSLVARVEGADPSRPALVLHGHLDVVPAMADDWSVDPFAGEIRDGMLWGRGAVDMKDMDAMILTALGDILGAGERPPRDLIVAFFADEENGGVYGSHWMVDNHPELFAGATEAISEVGGYSIDVGGRRAYLLQTGEKALVWIKLTARGTTAHGSRVIPDNAITKLARAVLAIGELEWPLQLTTHHDGAARRAARDARPGLRRRPGIDRGCDRDGRGIPARHAAGDLESDSARRRLQAQRDPRSRRGAHRPAPVRRVRRTRFWRASAR